MRKIDSGLVREAEAYVKKLLEERLPEAYLFHSWAHTFNVANSSVIIGRFSGLNENDINKVQISALFHDAGYVSSGETHETDSALIAGEFLQANRVAGPDIEMVISAILATRVPQQPTNAISEVLCDADLMHLCGDDYFEQMELLRLEWQRTGRYDLTEYQFHMNSINFFNAHQYHSSYGKTVMTVKKAANLLKIRQRAEFLL